MDTNNDKIEKKERKRRSKSFCELVDIHIIDLLIQGYSPIMIIKDLEDNFEFATSDNARAAIRRCNAKLVQSNNESFEEKVTKYLEMYQSLYKNAVDAGEWKTANGVLDSMVKLQNLTTQKIEAKIDNTYTITFD